MTKLYDGRCLDDFYKFKLISSHSKVYTYSFLSYKNFPLKF